VTLNSASLDVALLIDKDDDLHTEAHWLDQSLYSDWILRVLSQALLCTEEPCESQSKKSAQKLTEGQGQFLSQNQRRALAEKSTTVEVSVKLCSLGSMQGLNRDYRSKDAPTNVLSFPSEMQALEQPDGKTQFWPLGDVVLCPEVVAREADEQGKLLSHHRAHMIVHGVLHLLGYDHLEQVQAEAMEQLEIQILSENMVPDPYSDSAADDPALR